MWKLVITLNIGTLDEPHIYIAESNRAIAIGSNLQEVIKNYMIAEVS